MYVLFCEVRSYIYICICEGEQETRRESFLTIAWRKKQIIQPGQGMWGEGRARKKYEFTAAGGNVRKRN